MTCGELRHLATGRSAQPAIPIQGILRVDRCIPVDPTEGESGEWQALVRVNVDGINYDSLLVDFLPSDDTRAGPQFVVPDGLPRGLQPALLDSALRRCHNAAVALLRSIDSSRGVEEQLSELLPVVITFDVGASPPSN